MAALDNPAEPAAGRLSHRLSNHPWALVLKLAVSVGLLLLIADSVDLQVVGDLLLGLPLWAGSTAVASLIGITLVSSLRWWLVMRAMGTAQPLARLTEVMFIGSFFTQVLPTSVGGDAVRIWQVTRHGIAFQRAFIGVMLERLSGLVALVAMVVGGVLWLGPVVDQPSLRWLLLASLPALGAVLVAVCLLDRLPAALARHLDRIRLFGAALDLLAAMAVDARRVLLAQPLSLCLR